MLLGSFLCLWTPGDSASAVDWSSDMFTEIIKYGSPLDPLLSSDLKCVTASDCYHYNTFLSDIIQWFRKMMHVYIGTLIHSTNSDPLQILPESLLVVHNEKIIYIGQSNQLDHIQDKYGIENESLTYLKEWEFLMPGLVDTHIHAPQYVYAGTNLDLGLLEWLKKYTYPMEAKFKDLEFARNVYPKVVRRLLKNGTTTACYFATLHNPASLELADTVEKYGQRAYVGKVNIDTNAPGYYTEDTSHSLDETKRFVEALQAKKNPLITPVVTPRFALTSTEQLLQGLGRYVSDNNLYVQSHISESKAECVTVKDRFPKSKSYADVYDNYGLLTDKTIMAHGVYLDDTEFETFQLKGSGISHCPNSNISLKSGLLDVRRVLQHGVKLGLGTDCAGGYNSSILDSMRFAVTTSNIISFDHSCSGYIPVNIREAFRLATLGGAKVMGLDSKIGNFEKGKEFDALRINMACEDSPIDLFSTDTNIEDYIQKFFFLGDSRNIKTVFVAGKQLDLA